jgi:hypothetical protein
MTGDVSTNSFHDLPCATDIHLHVALPMYDPATLLNAAARHKEGTVRSRSQIEKEHGVRWSEMARLVGFEHSAFAPPDTMHGSALGK